MKAIVQLSLLLLTLVSFNLAAQTQSCSDSILETAPASRFTTNNDGTVTDTKTGLMWAACVQGLSGSGCSNGAPGGFDWSLALAETQATSDTQGRTDWRLPNIKELQSLVERRCSEPAINLTVFPNAPGSGLGLLSLAWSASPVAGVTSEAWSVSFNRGSVDNNNRSLAFSVRLVRGGQ